MAETEIRQFNINFGPQHPAAHGVLRLVLAGAALISEFLGTLKLATASLTALMVITSPPVVRSTAIGWRAMKRREDRIRNVPAVRSS